MPRPRLRMGVGATVDVLVSKLHPKDVISKAYPNFTKNDKATGLIVLSQGPRQIRRQEKNVIIFRHDIRGDQDTPFECWAVERFIHIRQQGPEENFFPLIGGEVAVAGGQAGGDDKQQADGTEDQASFHGNVNLLVRDDYPAVPDEIHHLIGQPTLSPDDMDIARNLLRDQINDDNDPAPENIPDQNEMAQNIFSEWQHSGSCYRLKDGGRNQKPQLIHTQLHVPDLLELFEMFFFKHFIKSVIIPKTNQHLAAEGHRDLSYGEFLRWVGICLLMATLVGPDRTDFWSLSDIDKFKGAPFRLHEYMSRTRFDAILKCIFYTSDEPPAYRDRFWEVRQMLDGWNKNMNENFIPGWANCLDESMSVWTNKYTCPGWMFVPRKPWPFGNEYHMVCCCLSGVLWGLELVEGKDTPRQRPPRNVSKPGEHSWIVVATFESNLQEIFCCDS